KPAVVKAVTLEVDTTSGQKLALAASVGSLSLILRKAGEADVEDTRRVTLTDLGNPEPAMRKPPPVADAKRFSTVVVTRASNKQEYSVPIEDGNWREAIGAGQR